MEKGKLMSDDTIDNPIPVPDEGEPTEEQLRSEEAKRYRLERNELRDTNAQLIQESADREARLQATERQLVNQHLARKLADPNGDFWVRRDLASLRNDEGTVDLTKADTAADELLADSPHLRARANLPGAEQIGSAGMVGMGQRSMLDGDNTPAPEVRGWSDFLGDSQRSV
jgi:hypothetical protein